MPGSPEISTTLRRPSALSFHASIIESSSSRATGEVEPGRRREHRGQRRLARHRHLHDRLPAHRDRRHRIGDALEVELADALELVAAAAAREMPHDLGAQDLAAVGRGFEPLRLDHRQAEAVVAVEGDVADADADPHLDALLGAAAVVPVDRLLDRDRRGHRVDRRRERGHHAVAGVLHHEAAVHDDRVADERVVLHPQVVGRFLTDAGAQRGRPDEVGEQHRRGVDPTLCPGHGGEPRRGRR